MNATKLVTSLAIALLTTAAAPAAPHVPQLTFATTATQKPPVLNVSAFAGRDLAVPALLLGDTGQTIQVRADLYRVIAGRAAPLAKGQPLLDNHPLTTTIPNTTTLSLSIPEWTKPGTLLVKLWAGAGDADKLHAAGALKITVVSSDPLAPLAGQTIYTSTGVPTLLLKLLQPFRPTALTPDQPLPPAWRGIHLAPSPTPAAGSLTAGQVVIELTSETATRSLVAAPDGAGYRLVLSSSFAETLPDDPAAQKLLVQTLRASKQLGALEP